MTTRHYQVEDKIIGVENYSGYGLFISELGNSDIVYHHLGSPLTIRSKSSYVLSTSNKLYYTVLSNVMNIPKVNKR